jgi:methylmalonyl-CoA/ethylmalonyl-CoA epimerase
MTQRERIYQMAYLVDDLEAAASDWHRLAGAGPFFVMPHFAFLEPVYRGASTAPDISIALGYCGDVMIELMVDHGGSSVFGEVPRAKGAPPTLHHVAQLTDNIDATLARFASAGAPTVFAAKFPPDTRCAFVDTRAGLGCFTEVIEATAPLIGLQQVMREATDAWDGQQLILTF